MPTAAVDKQNGAASSGHAHAEWAWHPAENAL